MTATENRGLLLKNAREKLGLSINDVAVATKINPRILKALEDDQRELLPAKSFTRGFIRTYAAYLKIDAKPILETYDSDTDIRPPKKEESTTAAASPDKVASNKKQGSMLGRTSVSPSSKIVLIASILFLVVLIIGIKKVVDKYAHERTVENVSRAIPGASPSPAGSGDVNASARPNPEASVSPIADTDEDGGDDGSATTATATTTAVTSASPQPTPSASPAKAPEPAKASDKLADKPVDVAAKAIAISLPTPMVTDAAAKPKSKPSPSPSPSQTAQADTAKPGKSQEVIIEALDNVEVTIQIDDEPSTTVKLTPESIHTIKAKSQIDLQIADGGMVNLIYNGHERGVPGVLGKPAKIKFP